MISYYFKMYISMQFSSEYPSACHCWQAYHRLPTSESNTKSVTYSHKKVWLVSDEKVQLFDCSILQHSVHIHDRWENGWWDLTEVAMVIYALSKWVNEGGILNVLMSVQYRHSYFIMLWSLLTQLHFKQCHQQWALCHTPEPYIWPPSRSPLLLWQAVQYPNN